MKLSTPIKVASGGPPCGRNRLITSVRAVWFNAVLGILHESKNMGLRRPVAFDVAFGAAAIHQMCRGLVSKLFSALLDKTKIIKWFYATRGGGKRREKRKGQRKRTYKDPRMHHPLRSCPIALRGH